MFIFYVYCILVCWGRGEYGFFFYIEKFKLLEVLLCGNVVLGFIEVRGSLRVL